jgi:hypothetical protein
MDNSSDHLAAVRVPEDEVDLYNVTEGGWYAVDDEDKAVLGPFESLGQCDRAIHDRLHIASQRPQSGSRMHA